VGRPNPGSCIILYYHAIASGQREQFARQLDIALRWSNPTVAGRREFLQPGKNYFAITFDDALECVRENALPELHCRGIHSTIFVVTKSLDKVPIWMTNAFATSTKYKVMSKEGLRGSLSDLVAIGSHSLTHPRLCNVGEAEARRQICESRIDLETLLQTPVTLFSFPYGAFDDETVRFCRDAGYHRVFTTLPKPALSDPSEFVCGRVIAEPTDWSLEFFLKIQGAYSWLPRAFALKRKLKSLFQNGRYSQSERKIHDKSNPYVTD
jgi:peptidoglycan/xylan/chitin deacetylase (PgdA/CDA1 family)